MGSFQYTVFSRKTAERQRLAAESPLPDLDGMGRGGGLWRVTCDGSRGLARRPIGKRERKAVRKKSPAADFDRVILTEFVQAVLQTSLTRESGL